MPCLECVTPVHEVPQTDIYTHWIDTSDFCISVGDPPDMFALRI